MTDSTPSTRRSPRQRRSTMTRERLLEVGFEAFAAKGYEGVNLVEDVLEPAGISIGSFYHQFADKAELLEVILSEAAARRRRFIVELGDLAGSDDHRGGGAAGADAEVDDVELAMRDIVERLCDSLEADAAAWRLQRISRAEPGGAPAGTGRAGREPWTADLARLLARWFPHPEHERRRAAEMIVILGRGFIAEYLELTPEQRAARRADLVEAATTVVVASLRALLPRR